MDVAWAYEGRGEENRMKNENGLKNREGQQATIEGGGQESEKRRR